MNKKVDRLASTYSNLKKAQLKINEEIRDCEEKLIKLYGSTNKEEGSRTFKTGKFRVTVTNKVNHSIDQEILRKLAIPKKLLPVRVKHELDVKKYRILQAEHAEYYNHFNSCITSNPAKVSIKVEQL